MRNLARWFAAHPVDLAYVSMLKHDAYVAVEAGRRQGFPVVLRPEGAGATGDLAWQSWGNFGRKIGHRCKQADAFVAISRDIAHELSEGGYEPARIIRCPTASRSRRVPGSAGQTGGRRPRRLRGPAGARERAEDADRRLARGARRPSRRPADPDRRGPRTAGAGSTARSLGLTLGPDQAVEIPGAVADVTAAFATPTCLSCPRRKRA